MYMYAAIYVFVCMLVNYELYIRASLLSMKGGT